MRAYSEDLRRKVIEAAELGVLQNSHCSPLWHQPLLRQALREDGTPGKTPLSQEGDRVAPQDR